MKRPILIALIGYGIGILWGLYLNISIVFFVCTLMLVRYLQKRIRMSYKEKRRKKQYNTRRYVKLVLNGKIMAMIGTMAILSNSVVLRINSCYEKVEHELGEASYIGTIISEVKEKTYEDQYRIRLESVNKDKTYLDKEFVVHIKKQKETNILSYGDKISFRGTYMPPQSQRNYGGFDEKQYARTIGIYGKIKTNKVMVIGKGKVNPIEEMASRVRQQILKRIKEIIPEEDNRNLILGILLGQDDELSDTIKEDFRNSSLAHILAVSGMHVSYLILGISFLIQHARCSKKIGKGIMILFLLFFMYLTGLSPSVKRACIMSILMLGAGFVYRKSDTITNLSFSFLLILFQNPFAIQDIGMLLSFLGTGGILIFYQNIQTTFNKKNIQNMLIDKKKLQETLSIKIKEILAISLSAQIAILPATVFCFNTISLTFLFSNLFVSFLIGGIIFLGFAVIIIPHAMLFLAEFSYIFLRILLRMLLAISQFFSQIPFSKITVVTPNFFFILLYYFLVLSINYVIMLRNKKKLRHTQKKILDLVVKEKKRLKESKIPVVIVTIILIIMMIISKQIPKDLKIYFIDIGQGDSTLVVTPNGKRMLIDTGGSKTPTIFDVGKSTLVPYLLDRGIKQLDYLCISHFDADHCNGAIAVLENLEIEEVILTKQINACEEYNKIIEIIKRRKIKVKVVKKGDRILLDNTTYLNILYPEEELKFSDLNNNSMVAKLEYGKFSMLFTGDIEEEAEQKLQELYKKSNQLESTILKVAHHGSKSSSTEEILKRIKPKIAIIRCRRK